jgi:hypothetical protein
MNVCSAFAFTPAAIMSEAKVCRHSWRVIGVHLRSFHAFTARALTVLGSNALLSSAAKTRRWTAQGGSRELATQVAVWGVPAGLVGGRLYYLATTRRLKLVSTPAAAGT